MSTGRSRLEIGTYGDLSTTRTSAGHDPGRGTLPGRGRAGPQVTATAPTVGAAKKALRDKLARRSTATGLGAALSPESTVADLAAAWLEDVAIRTDLAAGTKDLYAREVASLVLPHLKGLRLREVTVGRIDQFLKRQARVSYAHAKHSRRVVSMMFNFALRHDGVHFNPVAGAARLAAPRVRPKALTYEQVEQVRHAARTWRTGASVSGPRPDGQVREVIEVLLGTSDRIGEALALRACDIDDSRAAEGLPMRVTVTGTLVVIKGRGVYRQDFPKTSNSRRTLEVPEFTAEVIRHRLEVLAQKDVDGDHLLFFTRKDTPLAPNNVRRTLRKMLADAGLADLQVSPHAFRRTSGTVIARATDAKTAAEVMGNTEQVAQRHYIEPDAPVPHTAPAIHLVAFGAEVGGGDRMSAREPATRASSTGVGVRLTALRVCTYSYPYIEEVDVAATARLEVRVRPDSKARLERAAALTQVPVSEFVRSAAEERAEQVLAEYDAQTVVSAEFYEELLAALDAPAQPNAALSRAARRARDLVVG